MKTNKEYPATHSMATSWFAIDADGNVAIMNYEDNGPIPVGTPESSPEEIIMTTFSIDVEGKPWKSLPLSKDEIQYLMDNTEEYPDRLRDGEGFYYAVVKVRKDGMDAFAKAAVVFQSDDWGTTVCLDEEEGIFYLDWFAHEEDKKKVIRQIESLGIIEPLRKIFQSDEDDCSELKGLPFYGYQQWYSPWLPMEKLITPRFVFVTTIPITTGVFLTYISPYTLTERFPLLSVYIFCFFLSFCCFKNKKNGGFNGDNNHT